MKKRFFYAAAMAAMLASCSENYEPAVSQGNNTPAVKGETPVGFGVYTERDVTRAGRLGPINTDSLKKADAGFGVFAYYTNALDYTSRETPNFMYNQGVTYDETNGWTYEPVKYWPNEYGDAAISTDQDKVSFFAYAPFVESDGNGVVADGDGTTTAKGSGIMGFTKNTYSGDPLVKYQTNFNVANQVDLCWGTVHSDNANGQWGLVNGGAQTFTAGMPWIDVEHPAKIDQKMKFNFRHALAQLNVQIDVDADFEAHGDENDGADSQTKVYVREITFGGGIALKGALNLNNTEANVARWMDYSGLGELKATTDGITVKDGRKDGKEGASAATNEKVTGLNPAIISDTGNTTVGVTEKPVNLFNTGAQKNAADSLAASIHVIPMPDEALTVTIVYDVETTDPKLAGYLSDGKTHGSSIENRITKEVTFNNGGLKSGYKHTLKLHLGLNSVKFDAAVTDWQANGGTTDKWLPSNTASGNFNALNPLTIVSLASEGAINKSGAEAVTQTIKGLTYDNEGTSTPNILTLSAETSNNWLSSDGNIVQIKAAPAASSARGTRADGGDDTGWSTSAVGKSIQVKPMNPGTAIITATNEDGEQSKIEIVVQAPKVVLSETKVTAYAFKSNSPTATITASIDAGNSGLTDKLKEVKVDETSNCTATLDVNNGEVTITPLIAGTTATLTVYSESGASATCTVTINKPSITLTPNTTEVSILNGKTFSLAAKGTPEDVELEAVISEADGANISYSLEDGIIKALKETEEGTPAKLTIQFKGHDDDKKEIKVTVMESVTAPMKKDALANNPLWKVAEYNVAAPDADGKYHMQTKHATSGQWVYTWEDAKKISISGYKLPTYDQQVSIIPSDQTGKAGTNIFGQGTGNGYYEMKAGNTTAAGDGNYFYRAAANDYYAVRVFGETVTAWHYKFGASAAYGGVTGLQIDSYVIDSGDGEGKAKKPTDLASAKALLLAVAESDVWAGPANKKPEASSEESSFASRFLPACGSRYDGAGSGVATANVGTYGLYWSGTLVGASADAFRWRFSSGFMGENSAAQTCPFSVRLFRE